MIDRAAKDQSTGDNPVAAIRHATRYGTGECLGLSLHLWCPGCQQLHSPTFRCSEHGGPTEGPTWDGDPHARPVTFEPSLLVQSGNADGPTVCHSFVRAGRWQYLDDSTHALAGQTVDVEPLPDWLVREDD